MTGRILGAKTSSDLLAIFEAEEEQFGWHTAIKLINNSAKRNHAVDKADERLQRLLSLL